MIWRGVPELLNQVIDQSVPADAALRRLFGSQRRLGKRDRAQVADAVYGVLRHLRSLGHLLPGPGSEPWPRPESAELLAAWLHRYSDHPAAEAAAIAGAAAGYDDARVQTLAGRLKAAPGAEPAATAVRLDLPDWLFADLSARLSDDELEAFASTVKQPAPLDLRVNTLRSRPAAARQALLADGVAVEPGRLSPVALRSAQHRPLGNSQAMRDGWIEVQDEGSQLVAPLLEPRRGETVVDLCAGAGGKSLHLAALMAGRGHIHAYDPSQRRLDQLKKRCRQAGVDIVRPVLIADEQADALKRLRGKADRVLVDAPCSGSGTLRRRPEVCWQTHDLDALTATQDALLDAAAALLKPGGRLVYATCSLLEVENGQRAEAFERRNGRFTPLALAPILKRRKIGLEVDADACRLQLYPHRHGCDGFFAAVWERSG